MIPSFYVARWLSERWVITEALRFKSFTLKAADNRSSPKPPAGKLDMIRVFAFLEGDGFPFGDQ